MKIKDDQIESVWAGMRERRLERKLRKWHREYSLSPDMCNWLTWEEYKKMRLKFNKRVFTWEEISAYKEKLRVCACQYDKSHQCPDKNNNVEYFDICKRDCRFFPKTCPNCNEVLEQGDSCNLCGWTEHKQEGE